jgi:CRP-like cAMP-binding protein
MEQYLQSFGILTDSEISALLTKSRRITIKKGDFFIREGQVCREVAYIQSGLFRSFYHNAEGEQITYCFLFSNSFVTAYSSFITQEKTQENIQALTDTEIVAISRQGIKEMEQISVNFLRVSKILAEQEYMLMERRVIQLLKESAENRYRDLLLNQPEYVQMIPLNFLASYLGITQRHLSRIRKSVSI